MGEKKRVIVFTDISSMEGGVGEMQESIGNQYIVTGLLTGTIYCVKLYL